MDIFSYLRLFGEDKCSDNFMIDGKIEAQLMFKQLQFINKKESIIIFR